MSRVFVTGAAGFLGSWLCDRFCDLGHVVAGNDSMIGGEEVNFPSARAALYRADCCRADLMAKILGDWKPDVVIHCAATAHEGLSVFSPALITRNIFEATVSTLSAAIQAGAEQFVMMSSMARYGSAQGAPFKEWMSCRPVDPYGIAKLCAEGVLQVLAGVHEIEFNIAVPHNIIGPRQCFTDPFRNVVSIMANRNLRGLPAIIYGDGQQTRCFSYVSDCISCIERMALDPQITGEIINIGPDEGEVTINDLAMLVAAATGFAGKPIYMPARPCEVKVATCCSDKARELLGYKTKTNLADAIEATVAHIKKAGPKPFDYDRLPLEIRSDRTPKVWAEKMM